MLTDPVSSLTHFAGAVVAAGFGALLIERAALSESSEPPSRAARVAAMSVFVASAVVLLLASALFHAMPADTAWRTVTQRIDHAAIFVLIAGTFTPIHVVLFRGVARWGVLAFIWGAAAAGIALKTVFFSSLPEWVGVGAYLALGWVGAVSMAVCFRRYGVRFVSPLVLGGLAYSVGALCELTSQPTLITGVVGPHEVFHVAVLVGLGCMWMFIRRIARGRPEGVREGVAEGGPKPASALELAPIVARSMPQEDNMLIEINYRDGASSDALDENIRGTLTGTLGSLAGRLTRLEVHLGDENGPKSGKNDKRCLVEARPKGMDPIAVEVFGEDYYAVVDEAAGKLRRALTTKFEKAGI